MTDHKYISDHNAVKLELNNKSSTRKPANNCRLNDTLLNHQWVTEEIRKLIKNFLVFNYNKSTTY
jgi:hypothetical protein